MIHSWVRWARSKRTPSLVQKYQQSASESQDTWGADPRTEHGAKVANCWGAGCAGVCLCLPGLLLPGFRSPLPLLSGCALVGACCAAWLCCRFRCARLRCPLNFFKFDGHRPKNRKIFGQSTGVLSLASQKFSERWRKKEVSIYNENPVACWIEKRSFSSILAPTLQHAGKNNDEFSMCENWSTSSMLDAGL